MKNKNRQILAFLMGLLTVLMMLEAGLRIGGWCYQKSRASSDWFVTNKRNNSFVILCLGHSFTYGYGAPPGESYPDYLQRFFDERTAGKHVTVINSGVLMENTAELLDKLKTKINDTKPDLIILQTGDPNWYNFHKYSDYLKRTSADKMPFKKTLYHGYDFFYKSRVWRLLFLLKSDIDAKMGIKKSVDHSYRRGKEYRDSEKWIEASDRGSFADEKKVNKTINLIKKWIAMDPDYPTNYINIGWIYFMQKNYDEALKWCIKSVMVHPQHREDEDDRGRTLIWVMRYYSMSMGGQGEEIKEKIDKFLDEFQKTSHENLRDSDSVFLRNSEIRRWAEADIIEMIRIIRSRNIKIILQNYAQSIPPTFGVFINDTIDNIAARFHIPLVDNKKIFQEIMVNGAKDNEKYFVPDGHCNGRGYKIMARNVYNKIIEERMVP